MKTAWRSLMGGILATARSLSVGILRVMDKPAESKPVGKR